MRGAIFWEEWHTNEPLTISRTDYQKLILDYLNDIIPLADPTNGTIQKSCDICFANWIGNDDWDQLLAKIKSHMNSITDNQVKAFYQKFTDWLETQLDWADIIAVEGNL